jgi:hypothetical protein
MRRFGVRRRLIVGLGGSFMVVFGQHSMAFISIEAEGGFWA